MASFRLKRGEAPVEGLTRVAAGRAERALGRIRGVDCGEADKAEAVHGARRDMKKLRTVLRLLQDELPRKVYERETERCRDAALELAASRDAEVKLQTLERLVEESADLPEEAVESWRRILEQERKLVVNTDEGALAEAAESIEAARAGIGGWRLRGKGWKAIDGALGRVYRRGRRAMREAEAEPSEERLHLWRKRVKDLRYSLELLEGSWKPPLEATAAEAHRLTDLLGDHHDLAVLGEDLAERRLSEEETRRLGAAIAARQERLAAAAFGLGRRLYAERPKDFSRRLRRYWKIWRG